MAQFVVTSYQLKKWGVAMQDAHNALPAITADTPPSISNASIELRLALGEIEDTLRASDETLPQEM